MCESTFEISGFWSHPSGGQRTPSSRKGTTIHLPQLKNQPSRLFRFPLSASKGCAERNPFHSFDLIVKPRSTDKANEKNRPAPAQPRWSDASFSRQPQNPLAIVQFLIGTEPNRRELMGRYALRKAIGTHAFTMGGRSIVSTRFHKCIVFEP